MDGQMTLYEIANKPIKFHEAEWLKGNGFKNIYEEKPPVAGLYEWADIETPTKTRQLEYTENGCINLGRLAMGSFRAIWWRPIERKRQQPTYEELEAKYQIPRKHQKEEGWTDDWHYTELETPKESIIYYVICNTPQGHYNYTYMAWAYEHWWWFDSYQKKWHRCSAVRYENHIPFAWVEIPDLYLRTDSCLGERFEAFIEPKLNEYFEDQDRRRMERKEGRW